MAREWTEEQKQAARERLAKAREAKALKNAEPTVEDNDAGSPEQSRPPAVEHSAQDPNVAELTKMVLELKAQLEASKQSNPQTDLVEATKSLQGNNNQTDNRTGQRSGTIERFDTSLSTYPDIRPRLAQEPRLKRIAFDVNYELGWETKVVRYQTADNNWMKEPQFTLMLNQIVLDDDGEPTTRRIGKAKMIFFEDPDTAVVVAQQNGLAVDETNQREFLDEMRYLRARDWLLECFWPARPNADKENKQSMVIGGQVVDTWEVSAPEGTSVKIPFDQLNKA